MKGERLVARVHSMGLKMDSLLYATLGSLLRNRLVSAPVDLTDTYSRVWKLCAASPGPRAFGPWAGQAGF